MKLEKTVQLKLSCYCCGGIDFENKPMKWNEIEDMYFLDIEDNILVKCTKCGLEDYIFNLVPRGFINEELI